MIRVLNKQLYELKQRLTETNYIRSNIYMFIVATDSNHTEYEYKVCVCIGVVCVCVCLCVGVFVCVVRHGITNEIVQIVRYANLDRGSFNTS